MPNVIASVTVACFGPSRARLFRLLFSSAIPRMVEFPQLSVRDLRVQRCGEWGSTGAHFEPAFSTWFGLVRLFGR